MTSSVKRRTPLPPIPSETTSTAMTSLTTGSTIDEAFERQKSNMATVSVNELFGELEVRTANLKAAADFSTDKCSADIKYLVAASKHGSSLQIRESIAEKMLSLDVAELFQRAWKVHFTEDFLDKSRDPLCENMTSLMTVVWNMTDKSTPLCLRCLHIQLHQDVLLYMQDVRLDPAKTKTVRIGRVVRGLIGILHNILYRVSEARQPVRDCNGVGVIQRFRQSADPIVSCRAVVLQGFLVDESENETVNSDKETFTFLHKVLSSAIKSYEHYSNLYGFNATEAVSCVNILAANDSNKQRIVETGFLSLYVRMLQPDFNIAEQIAATHGLWTLAFKCRDVIIKESGSIDALKGLSETSPDAVVRCQSRGALWILEGKEQQSHAVPVSSSATPVVATGQHVFLSYQWDSKPTVLMIRDRVKAAGYKVWVDVDNISGSVLEAMAEAVENAAVVLVCLTHKYKESPNCRTEAEYTFRRRKPLIPLRLEDRYTPDGWLGALCGNNVIYDFSVQSKIETSFSGLMRSLGEIYNTEVAQSSTSASEDSKQTSSTTHLPHGQAVDVSKWTHDDITNWLTTNELEQHTTWFGDINGPMLSEMLQMRRETPDTLYAMLREDLNLTLKDILKLNCAFRQLQ